MASFSRLMANLFFGPMGGHRSLAPASVKIRELGYRLFRIEPSFATDDGAVNPDAMACSDMRQHTLIAEWTGKWYPYKTKPEQIRRYLRVEKKDLLAAGLRSEAASTSSTWVVVRRRAATKYDVLLDSVGSCPDKLMLCTFEPKRPCRLRHRRGNLADEELCALMKAGMTFEHIPLGYARVATDHLTVPTLAEAVSQEVVSLAVNRQDRFTVKELCAALFHIWGQLGQARQSQISKAVNKTVKKLASDEYCGRWLRQAKRGTNPAWSLVGMTTLSSIESFGRLVKRFVADVSSRKD